MKKEKIIQKSYWKGKHRSKETKEKISNTLKGGGSLYKHGLSKTKIARVFYAAKQRCNNGKDPRYKDYGGRGIKMVWKSVEDFYKDMKPTYKEGLSLDRVDNNGNYCKSNCRWATPKEQSNNTRKNVKFKINNKEYTLRALAKITGLKAGTIYTRVRRGWTIQEAITRPEKYCFGCEGKGYSTELKGNEICLADFIGDKAYLHRSGGIRIHLCDCGRGKDLQMFFNVKKQFKD